MERTMRRFKEAMVVSMPPSFIETKRRQQKKRTSSTTTKSFSIGSGEFQPRLFRKHRVLLKETTNANTVSLLKGTLTDRQLEEKENTKSSSASFDLVLDDDQNDDDDALVVGELDDDDLDSDISSIGIPGELQGENSKSSRLLLTASFPSTPTSITCTSASTTTTRQDGAPLGRKELSLWRKSTVTDTCNSTSNTTLARARSQMALGHAYLQRKHYAQAKTVLREACRLYEQIHGPNHVSVALALDTYALTCRDDAQEALSTLQRALQIRNHHLGVWHVDTVDTFNKIAGVHIQSGQLHKALSQYREVLKVRQAMLGPHHPSVAITCHALAKLYGQLGQPLESKTHFEMAKTIYQQLGMRYDHRAMANLLKDEHRFQKEGSSLFETSMIAEF